MGKTFVLHDESVNTHGYWMVTAGCDISQFEKNPIMLWDHNHCWSDARDSKLPIGHWENVRIKGKQILADAVFDADEFSQMIAKKVEANTLRMASVGARAIETSTDVKYIKQGQRYETVTKWQLKEASIVNIGANNNALALSAVLYDESDAILQLSSSAESPLKELSTKPKSMNKELLKMLELSADATELDVATAVKTVMAKNTEAAAKIKEALAQNVELTTERDTLQTKLDAIALADKEAQKAEFEADLELAAKDGRVDFDKEGKTKERWLNLFDLSPEDAKLSLADLPKRKSPLQRLSDDGGGAKTAWEKRQEEIAANARTAENR